MGIKFEGWELKKSKSRVLFRESYYSTNPEGYEAVVSTHKQFWSFESQYETPAKAWIDAMSRWNKLMNHGQYIPSRELQIAANAEPIHDF